MSSHKKHRAHKLHKGLKLSAAILAVILLAGVGYLAYDQFLNEPEIIMNQETVLNQHLASEPSKKGVLKTFTGEEFRDLYNNFAYPNTEYINEDTVITGEAEIDSHIQKLAEARGYERRSAPVSDSFVVVEKDMKLQERASEPWLKMKEAAKKDGIDFHLTAAYRSAEEQREILTSRLAEAGVNLGYIKPGIYDAQINQVLAMTAIPGYSRHHTGYTIDIGCTAEPTAAFEFTECYEWLSKDNYKNAKTYGWIPSYPEGAGKQGPEPETWEYVWVGIETLTE